MNRDLFNRAYAILDGIPANRWNLNFIARNRQSAKDVSNPNHCGTIGCALGWLGMHPGFIKETGMKTVMGGISIGGSHANCFFYEKVAAEVFAISEYDATNLFGAVGMSRYDSCGRSDYDDCTQSKKVFQQRVKQFLKEQTGFSLAA